MKKLIIPIILLLFALPVLATPATLYDYYAEKGENLPPVSERAPLYAQIADDHYIGSYAQNLALLAYLLDEQSFGATIPAAVADFETSLAAKITSSDTSMTLRSGTTDDSTTLSGTYGFVIDEGATTQEYVIATCSNTSCTSMTRGISTITGTSSVSALQFAHRRGASVKITDHPVLITIIQILNGRDTLPSLLTYDSSLSVSATDDNNTLITKKYADDLTAAGVATSTEITFGGGELATQSEMSTSYYDANSPKLLHTRYATSACDVASNNVLVSGSNGTLDSVCLDKTDSYAWSGNNTHAGTETYNATTTFNANLIPDGIVRPFTASTTITGASTPQPVYLATSTGALQLCDADDNMTYYEFLGFAVSSGSNGDTVYVQLDGIVDGFTGLSAGYRYYASSSAGSLATSPIQSGVKTMNVGKAISSTELVIERVKDYSAAVSGSDNVTYYTYADTYAYCYADGNSNAGSCIGYIDGTIRLKDSGGDAGEDAGFSMFVPRNHNWKCDCSITDGSIVINSFIFN